jgi:hypothetical protein
VEEYEKLLADACMAEIKKYDVILATCSASPSNRIQRGANVTQCIIDECGMCQEPESLIPLVAFKPKQVRNRLFKRNRKKQDLLVCLPAA